MRFHVPSFQDLVDTEVHTTEYSIGDFYAKMIMFDIAPLYTNVVVMNHTVNDNIAGLIRHEVDKNMSPDTMYSMYTTYRKK